MTRKVVLNIIGMLSLSCRPCGSLLSPQYLARSFLRGSLRAHRATSPFRLQLPRADHMQGTRRMIRLSTVQSLQCVSEQRVELEMPVCLIRCVEGEPHLTGTLCIAGKEKTFHRLQEDALETTIQRLERIAKEERKRGLSHGFKKPKKGKGKGKGKKRQMNSAAEEPEGVELEQAPLPVLEDISVWVEDVRGERVSEETMNKFALEDQFLLHVGNETYRMIKNVPEVNGLTVDEKPMAGFRLFADCELQFASESASKWEWYRLTAGEESLNDGEEGSAEEEFHSRELVCTSQYYTPTEEDVGMQLLVQVTPGRQDEASGGLVTGEAETFMLKGEVRRGPDMSVHGKRLQHCREYESQRTSRLRIVSYNILADNYANTPFAVESLYHYCNQEYLQIDYRKQVFTWEILQYNAEIICLQEVCAELYDKYIEPTMKAAGYTGIYTNKISSSRIGCATFFKSDRFSLRGSALIVDLTSEWDRDETLRSLCSGSSEMAQNLHRALVRSTTVAQVITLEDNEKVGGRDHPLVITNTHLFGSPEAPHVRLVQMASLQKVLKSHCEKLGGSDWKSLPMVLCGDFNAPPAEGLHDFLSLGFIDRGHADWGKGMIFRSIDSRKEREANWFARKSMTAEDLMQESVLTSQPDVSAELEQPFAWRQTCKHVPATFCTSFATQVVDYIYIAGELE
eukprot:241564-Hanusia_phi.AAC.1